MLLWKKSVKNLVLTRPTVENGPGIGYLPGDMHEKMDPYMLPLYEAIEDLDSNRLKPKVEIAPLCYMQGRTFKDSYVILDEAQNATVKQVKMLLTRFGPGSKIVIIGDTDQTNLDERNGLDDAWCRLQYATCVGRVQLNYNDIVRSEVVQEVLKYYDSENN